MRLCLFVILMFNTRIVAAIIENWLVATKNHFEEFACTVNIAINASVDPNLDELYKNICDNNYYNQLSANNSLFTSTSYNLFISSWPMFNYVQKLNLICCNKSIVNLVVQDASQNQIEDLESALLNIIPNLVKQELIIKLLNEQRQISQTMLSEWNNSQKSLFKSLVSFYSVCSEIYLQKPIANIRGFLMCKDTAPIWLEYLFGDNSKFLANTNNNIKKKHRLKSIYNWCRLLSSFGLFSSALLISLGSAKFRDLYVLFAILSVAVFVGTFIHKKISTKNSIDQKEEAIRFLRDTNIGPSYNPEMKLPNPVHLSQGSVDFSDDLMLRLEIGC